MSNSLIYKVQPTLSVDSVQNDLVNYEITNTYTTKNEKIAVIAGTTGSAITLDLPSPASLPATATFVELISDQDLTITFNTTTGATTQEIADVKYLAGHFLAHSFVASNANTTEANITWRNYTT